MTTNPTLIPEPTAPGVVVRGTIDGKTVRAIRECDGGAAWTIYSGRVVSGWLGWTRLLAMLDEAPTIIDTDQPTGLTEEQREALDAAAGHLLERNREVAEQLWDAFPDVFTEPEPAADIPDEVVEAACRASGVSNPDSVDFAHMRAALAAADAKRAELEGVQRIDRGKLIALLRDEWVDPVWTADAVLDALPELMGGEQK